jgi:UDP-N-acetylmuramyl pentapeptide phosphotransferase/UDP-N-acetylglucosamine-1-phosphate transferase
MPAEDRRPVTVALTVLAYVVVTFGVQGTSHFAINAEHYAAIPIMRAEPVIAMGVTSMVIQGLLFAWLFPIFNRRGSAVRNGIVFSWALGAFLASYIILGEAGKYAIPSIPSWIAIEASTAFAQYTLFGAVLGWLHRRDVAVPAGQMA